MRPTVSVLARARSGGGDDRRRRPLAAEDEPARYPRAKFFEGATIGIGAMIGGVITLPVVGFAIGPAFIDQGYDDVDLGPLDNFPAGQFMITTFYSKGDEYGDVGLRTAYIRNNGLVDEVPSFTILSSRCVHLGCPVQPQGPISDEEKKSVKAKGGRGHPHPHAALGLRLPVPRRRLQRRRRPDSRAAGSVARPLSLRDHRREPRAEDPVQRQRGRRNRR